MDEVKKCFDSCNNCKHLRYFQHAPYCNIEKAFMPSLSGCCTDFEPDEELFN